MRSGADAERAGFVPAAAAVGALAGLAALVLLGTLLGLVLYRYPVAPGTREWAVLGTRVVAYLIAGIWAGRRAAGVGLAHGVAAGLLQLAVVLAISLIAREGWPTGMALLRQLALACGAGALGGVLGVNLAV